MSEAIVTLKKGEGRMLKSGGLWIFDNEIASILGSFEDGDIVAVHDFDGYGLGKGFINRNSKIRVRMMTRNRHQEIDEAFLKMRVQEAWDYRKKVSDTGSCRVIFGEADFLPGIVIDKFEDVLVVESLALGIDRLKPVILDKLKKVLAEDGILIRGIYERSDAKVRRQEGMELYKGFIGEAFDTNVEIEENGVRYMVDVKDGQKTGFFLDQKYNRKAIQHLCKDAKVLDCFTHTGSFALNAGYGGAKEVTGVDASELAVEQAILNSKLNGMEDRVKFICRDVFELLPELEEKGEKFDVVILDPPAFTKSRNSVKNAVKGYREINLRAMKLVRDGGSGDINKVALGVDIRSGMAFGELEQALERLRVPGFEPEILFLDADDKTLVKRYKETRRSHPLSGKGRVDEGIRKEREYLKFLRKSADYILDTSQLLTRELKAELEKIFVDNQSFQNMIITVLSFGFKYGIPEDADLVFDVRFLPNPYYIEELRPQTGNNPPVRDYVMRSELAHIFSDKLEDMMRFLIPNYISEGKSQLVIGIGCTGGKHRSVTLANELYNRLNKNGEYGVRIEHRDIEKDAKR